MVGRVGSLLRAYAEKDGRGYPDWAMRYVPIVRRLRRWGLGTCRVLEIGANENGLSRFSGARVIAVDIARDHLIAARASQDVLPVVASIDALPFADSGIDVCASVDTFEHLPSTRRQNAVVEMARVLKPGGVAVVAFPSGDGALVAERFVRERYRDVTGGKLRWLEEHAAEGLPEPEAIAAQFGSLLGSTHRISVANNANLGVWRWMWLVMMCTWPGRGNAAFQALLRLVTPVLTRVHLGECYRSIVWIEPSTSEGNSDG